MKNRVYHYNDIQFRLALAFVVGAILSLKAIGFPSVEKGNLQILSIHFIIYFILLWTSAEWIYHLQRYLDKKCQLRKRPFTRISLQLFLAIAVPFAFVSQIYLLLERFNIKIDMGYMGMYLILINLYYLCYNLLLEENLIKDIKGHYKQSLLVNKGMYFIPIPIIKISHLLLKEKQVYLITFDNQTYLMGQTLDDIQYQLDPQQFFRANRQVIVNYSACRQFALIENRKIKLEIIAESSSGFIISQKRSRAFREWMDR
ncbi:LytTR family DNA-binding domain-containing protein [Echinicola sp. 20G]|uniref:LytTR family DNA-binding domain-containing protein n=1 Tax=Echinicola sp. 20G TaxID=2781961 RepID=UPI0019106028|nr:LytTR family DNA-binding domain-containing protein [Echinicola sp. 20G]